MTNKSTVRFGLISSAVLAGLFIACFIFSQTFHLANVQASFVLIHQVAGAVISGFGTALVLVHCSGKLPTVPLGRSLLVLLIGLAIFSMSPVFAVAGAVVYAVDNIRPILKVESDESEL